MGAFSNVSIIEQYNGVGLRVKESGRYIWEKETVLTGDEWNERKRDFRRNKKAVLYDR